MNYVIIKAGGTGVRMQPCDRPKQFIEVNQKPIILYTLEQFQRHSEIDSICVSCIRGWEGYLQDFAQRCGITKLKWIAEGGKTGQESIENGLKTVMPYCGEDDIIIIHDAVRPLISHKIISEALSCAQEHGTAVVTAPCIESMLWSEDRTICHSSCDRMKLFMARAPQAFRYSLLKEVYQKAKDQGVKDSISTDNLFIQMGVPVYLIRGSVHNIKITTHDDVEMFQAMVAYGFFAKDVWDE